MAKVRQEINIITIPVTATGDDEAKVQLDTTQYEGTVTYYFESVASVASGTLTLTLQRSGTATSDATINVTATSPTRQRSSFTPPAGSTEYDINLSGGTTPNVRCARIVVIHQPSESTFGKSEDQVEIGNNERIDGNTLSPLSNPKYWRFDSANFDGTVTCYGELTYRVTNNMWGGSAFIQQDNGSFGGWSTVATIVSSGTATSATRVRESTGFTPVSGRHYRLAVQGDSSMSQVFAINAKVVVVQTGTVTKTEFQYLLSNAPETSGTGLKNYDNYFDPADWTDVSNTYVHEANSISAGTSDVKLQSDPNGSPADITGSALTNVSQLSSSTLTMPGSASEVDLNVTSMVQAINSSRIIARSVYSATGGPEFPTQMLGANF